MEGAVEFDFHGIVGVVVEKGVDEFAMGHLLLVEHDVGVVGSAELDEDIPGLGESGAAEGTAVDGLDTLQVIFFEVFEGVAVGVPLEAAESLDVHVFGTAEEAAVGDVFESSALEEDRRSGPPGQHHVGGVPGELIVPGVVVRFRRYQSARERLKGGEPVPFSLDALDDLHGRHVVYTRVEAHLVEEE